MKCSSITCGVEGSGKFCQECGAKMIEEVKTNTVVICSGKLDDDSPCHSELVPNQKFCMNCGIKVDASLFTSRQDTCRNCGIPLELGSVFCTECGQRQTSPVINDQSSVVTRENESAVSVVSRSRGVNEMEPVAKIEQTSSMDLAGNLSTEGIDDPTIYHRKALKGVQVNSDGLSSKHENVPLLTSDTCTVDTVMAVDVGNKSGTTDGADMETSDRNMSNTNDRTLEETIPGISQRNTEMTNESGTRESVVIQDEGKQQQTGNLNNVKPNPSKELSIQLEQVNLDTETSGNLTNIEDGVQLTNDGNPDKIVSDSDKDSMHDSDTSDDIGDLSLSPNAAATHVDNEQTKRNKKQHTKKNKIQRKKDRDEICVPKDKPPDEKPKTAVNTSNSAVGNKDSEVSHTNCSSETVKTEELHQKNEVECKVFGNAKSWKNEQTSNTTTLSDPIESSLFSTSNKDSNSNEPSCSTSTDILTQKDGQISPPAVDMNMNIEMDDDDDDDNNAANKDENKNEKGNGVGKAIDTHMVTDGGTDVDTGQKNKKKREKKQQKEKQQTQTYTGRANVTTRSVARSSGEPMMMVQFHILTSEKFQFDPAVHKCYIVMGNSEMGGWNNKDRLMKDKRPIEGGIYELVYETEISTRLITSGSHFPYKYFFKKREKEGRFEHYTKDGKTGKGVDRTLIIPQKYKTFDEWHQYDGFAEKEPDTLSLDKVKELMSWKADFAKHADKTIHEFCPTAYFIKQNGHSETLKIFQMLFESVKRVYYIDARCWNDINGFTKWIEKCLIPAMLGSWKMVNVGSEIQTDKRDNITGALLVIYIMKKLDIEIQEPNDLQRICKALLVTADTRSRQCPDVQVIEKYFPDERKFILNALLSLVKRLAGKTKDPSWLFVMPLVHFLSGKIAPYDVQVVDVSHAAVKPVWWGISEIQQELDFFKGKSEKWTIPFETVLEYLEPLFEMDYLLPRTFMTVVDLGDLNSVIQTGKIPVDVCLANLTYQVKTKRPACYYDNYYKKYRFPYATSDEKIVTKCIETLLEQLQGTFYSENFSLTQWTTCYAIAADLFEESVIADRNDIFYLSLQSLVHCLAMYDRCMIAKHETPSTHPNIPTLEQVLCASTSKAMNWMGKWRNNWNRYMANNLQIWNLLFAPKELQSERVRDEWNRTIADGLSQTLDSQVCRTSYVMKEFVQQYCQKCDEYNSYMQETMTKVAFQAISKGYALDYGHFSVDQNKRFGMLLSALFVNEWKKRVSESEKDIQQSILNHVLIWAPFQQYLTILFDRAGENKIAMTDECVENLVKAVVVIENRCSALSDGSITIGDFKIIQEKGDKFSELAYLVQSKKYRVTKVIEIRQKEIDAFKEQSEELTTLVTLCQHLPNVDRTAIDIILKKQDHIDEHMIKECCIPADASKVEEVESYQPKLCAFELSKPVLDMVPQLLVCSSSNTFMRLWIHQCQGINDQCDTLDDTVQQVWIPVKCRWDTMSDQIKSGVMKFRDFEKFLGEMYKEDYEFMKDEMKKLNVTDKSIKKRLDQLKKYRQLNTCVKGAQTLLKFTAEYQLTGEFDQIKDIATHVDNDMEMRSFDDNVMKACDFLKDLTLARKLCLETFVRCEPLVKWLQASMEKGGLKELKVFVDLAFMSAGDEPMNIARVECLHSAVTGYAPLIFGLKSTSGYEQLLDHCSTVWKELAANPKLPAALEETHRQLQWLKEIKKAHGSVEVTSLMQAEAINTNGIYTVGKNAWKKDAQAHTAEDTTINIANTLKLTVPEQVGKRQLKNYTFSQCQDLQSRLMLVAGKAEKGTDSVDRFTMIFDSITRLSNVYMKLCYSGCVLYKDWTARFVCDPSPKRPVCVVLEFGHGEGAPQLKGRSSQMEDLKDIIPELANFMENCLDDWLKHIKEKRKEFLHLNYFTVDQLVILQRELVKMGTETDPSHLVYPLLCAVKENCSPDDLVEAMTAAKKEIDGDTEMEAENDSDCSDAEMSVDATVDEWKQKYVHNLVDAGYDVNLVIRSLQYVDPEDVTAGIVWCIEHEDSALSDDDHDQPLAENTEHGTDDLQQRETFHGWSQSQTDIQTMISTNISGLRKQSNVGSEPLINDLTALWTHFLESISSNIRDYLGLEHLGVILKYLARKNTSEISRCLPPGFVEGQPNLIICPSGDVLMTTLSVYMMDKDKPLPQSDEILVCTANTTTDEVDIFWRRAIFDGSSKIHCLVNADMLNYDVSEAAERFLEEYLLEVHYKELKYRLLVICGSDNEYRSTIVSSLDKFKRQALATNTTHLRDYLSAKLTIQQHMFSGIRPAADVDKQRSSVRVIKSWRSGVGKTLFKQRREGELSSLNRKAVQSETVSIPLHEKRIDVHYVIQRLLEHTTKPGEVAARIFHIDVSHEVENGVDYLLFNLLVLGCLMDKTGFVWRKSTTDIYLIETMPLMMQATNRRVGDLQYVHPVLSILPDLTCRSPQESLQIYMGIQLQDYKNSDQLFDEKQFTSPVFQRTFQYLSRMDQGKKLIDVHPFTTEGSPQSCLQTLLRHCGLNDPSWSELHHFVWFLNTQLVDFERNEFVSTAATEDLPGFSKFVLTFLIQMSRDFSTRSLDMSEESPGLKPIHREHMEVDEGQDEEDNGDELQPYQMRRTWESSPHPYLFFNSDRFTFTFLGFFIDRASGNLIDQQTRTILTTGIMAQNLYDSLVRNHAPVQENFDALPRHEKIMKLCNVMGIDLPHDPDDTYELTTDNVKKIMAIYMRFRCDIPVIIMGETGCGKTRLVKFMSALQVPPGVEDTNMILMKVHGGTTNRDIINKVRQAENIAKQNKEKYGDHMYTVLFFDEANTTEAIGLIKEIMCDKSMEGKKLKLCENLKMVAACNPYRKHSDELIKKLEQAGLGYHVDADETTDRLGRVPMRRLVYRVQPLPQSMLPLVWDFGQLNTHVEDLYIRQMVRRYIREDRLPDIAGLIEVVSAILTASQDYMRDQRDECSFVSLRDVDRVLTVMSWFYQQSQGHRMLYQLMDEKLYDEDNDSSSEDDIDEEDEQDKVDDITRSLILALGVCYHACLKTRPQYRAHIAKHFRTPCKLPGMDDQIKEEIESCQEVFLDHVHLEKNIARNMALKENVFMMVVCIELRVPLFLVGKPGSSKSLAKTIVSDAMQGNAAREELFKELKQAQMVSFQCSPLSTPDGIVGTFRQCAQFQKDKDLDTFVSIVVLDEVGLAEDSPRMPLKTLHPLLEDGCQGDEKPEKHKKVAFIGISNWALDPAKMNRGILVQREVPDQEELVNSARGICSTNDKLDDWIDPLIEPMAISYLEIFEKASQNMREFYGLRDFYSLVKMVYSFVAKSKQKPTWHEMLHAIKRNFGGLDKVDPVQDFKRNLAQIIHFEEKPKHSDPDCSPAGLVQACLFDTNKMESESRYLLLLTENYGALSIIQQQILSRSSDIRPITIFGSSFRSDQEYTQVCRNINKIKVCMETGNTVVLLNLENLYESLYDALNQYYVYFGGERYVDLGLGTHRVKCPVHRNFRLIVVAEKQTVYKKFPIPLINRLEKHFLTINTMLSLEQQNVVQSLKDWAAEFVKQRHTGMRQLREKDTTKLGDVFIGYHDDTCSAIVLDVWEKHGHAKDEKDISTQILEEAKFVLLWCATPDSLVRLDKSSLPNEETKLLKDWYFHRQSHDSLIAYVEMKLAKQKCERLFAQVTTHSKLMAGVHKSEISKATGIGIEKIMLLETLSSFDTEQQFSNRIQQHIQKNTNKEPSLMVIQCDSGDVNANLIACARYCVMDEFEKMREELRAPVHVVFIVQLPRGAAFTGFQCGVWHSAHIDDLYTEDMNMPTLHEMMGKSVAKLFTDAVRGASAMEMEEDISRENASGEQMDRSVEETKPLHDGLDILEPGMEDRIRGGPLQLEDVLLDLQNVNQQNEPDYGQRRLNVKGLILACVQAALSMVKDKQENSSRETDRVALLLKLLHQEHDEGGQASFLHGVCCLIARLLKEKESKTHSAHMTQHWLINEAACKENINKAGTFRRSCIQTLETKVSPILAGIIAYLDTNNNLNILQESHCSWKQTVWLSFLNTADAINLQFTDLQSPTRQSDLKEVVVLTTGCEGHMFSSRMPFSWLLISKIGEILTLDHPSAGSHDHGEEEENISLAESSVRVLSEHALGRVLSCVHQEQTVTEAVHEYIYDFVHTLYHAGSEQEHQLVCQSVYYVANEVSTEARGNSLLHSLINVHLAYRTLAPRLTYFRAMNSVWPECSAAIVELTTTKPDHFMFKEQEFTFAALCLLLENIAPKGTDLDNSRGRSHWLNRVHRYRPVVEKVISLHGEDSNLYGAHSFQSVRRAKGLWSRVLVVKLFLEHVCASEREDKITIKHCMSLWMLLGEETDLKELKSLIGVERFLRSCNKQAMKEYMGAEVKCNGCESVLEGPPITLPCKHVLCDQCYDGMQALKENMCVKCRKQIPSDWTPERQTAKKDAIDKLKDYQKRCNTFFMDVVSQLCFAENRAPSQEVVEKLLGYIFFTTRGQRQRTRNLTIFDTGIDPNPVFRSFLLQLLMRTSEQNVKDNLRQYLSEAHAFIRDNSTDKEQHYVELSLLVIQCLEDMFTQEATRANVVETEYTSQALHQATQNINEEELTVEKLYALASARMGLATVAKYIAKIVSNQGDTRHIDRSVRKMIEAAEILCEDTNVKWTRVYLVKYLCRYYGIDIYQAICRDPAPYMRWICIRDMNRNQIVEVSDRYIVCGEHYHNIREAVTKVALGENVECLQETVQERHTAGVRVECLLQLAIHREITSSYLYPQQQRKLTPEVMLTLDTFVENCDSVKNKPLMRDMLINQLIPRHLVITEGEALRLQGIQCLLVHFQSVLSHVKGDRTLLQPLIALMTNPQTCVNMFLPTMPQDDLEDVKEALLAARNHAGGDTNPVFYRCPNGHPYVIGDCGRPETVGNCRDCGATIGGEDYTLRPGNIQDPGKDNTMTGHILGRADARGHGPKPERTLTPAYCASLRLLMHLAMYIGAGRNQQGIHRIIKPDIDVTHVEEFVWAHIQLDVDDLHRALGRSVDDVLLLMHTTIDSIMRNHQEGVPVGAEVSNLSSKEGRSQWETKISTRYIQDVFQNLDNTLKNNNQILAQDQRLGADPLLCQLYETDSNTVGENPASLQEIARVWRYRTPISLQHLRQDAESKLTHGQHKVLQLFLKEEHHLRALRYIPSILRLQRALFQKYQRKLDKAEASHITVAQLKRGEIAGAETTQLIQDFAEAWDLVRDALTLYLCPTELGGMIVSKEYCSKRISDTTPVSMLLPTNKEAGLCSYALLDFLLRKQNDFLDKYLKETHRNSGSITSIRPQEVTSAHLISYEPQHDILPLVLANCQYSFEMSKGTKIEYDFAGLERQLMDRYMFSKSRIDVGRVLLIDQMVYRTEFTNAAVFLKLGDKIPQVNLNAAVRTQICAELKSLPDVCQSLDNIDITISFLKSTGGQPDKTLHEFMMKTLKMELSIHSQKAQQICELQHAQSLWLLLSLQKSKKMIDHQHHTEFIFESVLPEFHDELPDELMPPLREYLKKLSVDKLSQLVDVLHEFILLVVAVRQNPDDDDFTETTNHKIGEWLYNYVDTMDTPPVDMKILADFPKDIVYKHSVHTWVSAYAMLKEKQTGHYSRY